MNAKIAGHISAMLDAAAKAGPSSIEFEVAYQGRVVMDRIRFAIRVTDQLPPKSDLLREAGIQLLDALSRLEHIDRRLQMRLSPREADQPSVAGVEEQQ